MNSYHRTILSVGNGLIKELNRKDVLIEHGTRLMTEDMFCQHIGVMHVHGQRMHERLDIGLMPILPLILSFAGVGVAQVGGMSHMSLV